MISDSFRVFLVLFAGWLALAAHETGEGHPQGTEPEPVRGQEVLGFKLSAAVVREEFVVGEPILVRLTTKNVSGKRARLVWSPYIWRVEGTDQLGREVPLTRQGRYTYGLVKGDPRTGGHRGRYLEAGESETEVIILNRLCDLSMTGRYSMVIGRELYDDKGNWAVGKAPPLELRVSGGYPRSAAPQVVKLDPRPGERSHALRSIGAQVREMTALLSEIADGEEGHEKDAATSELQEIQAQVEALKAEQTKSSAQATGIRNPPNAPKMKTKLRMSSSCESCATNK